MLVQLARQKQIGIHDRPMIFQIALSHTTILADGLLFFFGKNEVGDEIVPTLGIRDFHFQMAPCRGKVMLAAGGKNPFGFVILLSHNCISTLPQVSRSRDVIWWVLKIPLLKLQHEFKHANDYGIIGSWNEANKEAFQQAIQN